MIIEIICFIQNITEFDNYLTNFIKNKKSIDELFLTHSFICDVCNNDEILELLREGSFSAFQKEIFMYHANLLLNSCFKEVKNAKKEIFMQFKEFKIHRNYCGQIVNKQAYIKFFNKMNFINQHKNRKISHLRRAINIA